MNQTLSLHSIRKKWRDALKASPELEQFCRTHFEKPLRIFVGINIHELPGEKDCPFVIIGDGAKKEGETESNEYNLPLACGILCKEFTETDNVVEFKGVELIDEFCQLIYAVIADVSPNNPVTECDIETNSTDLFPMHVGKIEPTIEIPNTIGGSTIY